MSVPRPVLVVQHEDECPPAWFGDWLAEAGVLLDVRRAYDGDPLPDHLDDYAGLLVLGGAMGANDDTECPWLGPTRSLLRVALAAEVPTLGICLGHQLLAVAAGGRIDRHGAGFQCGLVPIGWTTEAAGDPLFGALVRAGGYQDPVAVQWNVDVVTALPAGAVPLAHTAGGAVQAMRVGATAWGIQSHPEAGRAIVGAWIDNAGTAAGAAERRLLCDLEPANARLQLAWRPLAEGFAGQCSAAR